MGVISYSRKLRGLGRWVTILVLTALLAGGGLAPAWAQGGTVVRIDPATVQIEVGQTVVLSVRIENVTNLFGAEVHLQFNPAILQVVDADDSRSGVQVQPGPFPGADFVAQNLADNFAGTVDFAASRMAPNTAVSGSGVFVMVTFRAVAQGVSAVSIQEAKLANPDGQPLAATLQHGQIFAGVPPTDTPTATATPVTPTSTPTATPVTPTDTPTVTPTGVPPMPTPTSTPALTVTPGPCTYTYVVRTGDTLWSIARRFGTTVQAIIQANGIINPNYIRIGQVLCIPGGTPPPTPPPTIYIVQPGDTLWSIARRFGTTVEAIAWVNGIINPWYIYIGQRLVIPGGIEPPPSQVVYTVRWGDTLWSIARRFGTTAWAIALANNLWNPNFIYVGQRLIIPV